MERRITALDDSDDDDGGWNLEASGNVSGILFGNALSVWTVAQARPVSVSEAALAFNVQPKLIRQAVEGHYWMFINAAGEIEHDGE